VYILYKIMKEHTEHITVYIYKQYIERHNNLGSAGRAPSLLDLPWHLPYN